MQHKLEKIASSNKSNAWLLRLEGEMTLSQAVEARDVFLKSLNGADHLVIDISKVAPVDLSFLQLLCSLHLTALKTGKTVRLGDEISTAVRDIVLSSGFSRTKACIDNSPSTGVQSGQSSGSVASGAGSDSNCFWIERLVV
ncbi:MAG: STAS domain-containing protein [Candidatus Riflebacteria bacterium]|nr:STAS domain-containing protein [Candidatus Riflebacteria bacterium]